MSFQDNKMLIMPAVDIKNGKCVQLVQGEPGTEQVIIENPEKVARKWEDLGAEVVHVIDLDGALESTTNIETTGFFEFFGAIGEVQLTPNDFSENKSVRCMKRAVKIPKNPPTDAPKI